MVVELTFFSLSGLVIIGLFIHKHLEQSNGQVHASVHETRRRADNFFHDVFMSIHGALSRITSKNAIIAVNAGVVVIVRGILAVIDFIRNNVHTFVEKASRKQETLKNGGAASFYLKQIKDVKENNHSPYENKQ